MKEYNGQDVTKMSLKEIDQLCSSVHPLFAGIIYCYTNRKNGKTYIGQTSCPIQRHKQHIKYAHTQNKEKELPIHRAIQKYGIDGFNYQVLDFLVAEYDSELKRLLDAFEVVRIHEFHSLVTQNGYNSSIGGDCVGIGRSHPNSKPVQEWDLTTQELIATYPSLTEAGKAHGVTDGVIRNLVKHRTFKLKNSVFCYAEDDAPIFEDPREPERKKFYQYDLDGNYIRFFYSLADAAQASGANKTAISTACNSGQGSHKAGNYLWYLYRHSNCPPFKKEEPQLHLYNENGEYVASFYQKSDIARHFNITGMMGIYRAICDKNWTIKGHYIRTYKFKRITDFQPRDYHERYPGAKIVSCYDENGVLEKTFNCQQDAADWLGMAQPSGVSLAIKEPWRFYRNHYWRYGNEATTILLPEPEGLKKYKYSVYNAATNELVGQFQYATEMIRQLGLTASTVAACLKGKLKTHHGYRFVKNDC